VPEEQNTEQTEEQTTDEATEETKAGDKPTEGAEETDEEKAAREAAEEVPAEVLREEVTKANNEAANYRTKLREAEERLKNAKSPEEVDEIVKQLQADRETSEAALLRENVALKFKLPEKAIKRLAGSTREELEADAKELAELFGTSDQDDEDLDLEGGLEPRNRESAEATDPRSLALKHSKRSKRRR
jgi:hypothetical protein